jgi:hypothetical protein
VERCLPAAAGRGRRGGHPWSAASLARPTGREPGGARLPNDLEVFNGGEALDGFASPGYTYTLAEPRVYSVFLTLWAAAS